MSAERHALVFGASGFIGRWLVVELASQGVRVTAAVRSSASADELDDLAAGARRYQRHRQRPGRLRRR